MQPGTASKGRFRIRQANEADLPTIADVQLRAWRETYTDLEERFFVEHEEGIPAQIDTWRAELLLGTYIWVVYDTDNGDEIVGFARAGHARDDDAPGPLELWQFYLLTVAHGSGIADHLITMALGDAPAYLWVFQTNARAMAFYRRHGFELDGVERDFGGEVPDVRMVRS